MGLTVGHSLLDTGHHQDSSSSALYAEEAGNGHPNVNLRVQVKGLIKHFLPPKIFIELKLGHKNNVEKSLLQAELKIHLPAGFWNHHQRPLLYDIL